MNNYAQVSRKIPLSTIDIQLLNFVTYSSLAIINYISFQILL